MKKYTRLKLFATLLLLTVALFVSACSANEAAHPRDTLRIDIAGDITSFDPQSMVDSNTFRILSDLDEGLVGMNQADQPIAGMAESWIISPDGKTYTFYLRHDLKFSDGKPITANDFVYSWQRLADPKTGGYSFVIDHLQNAPQIIAGILPATKLGVRALDPFTLQAVLEIPDPAFLAKCTTVFASAVPRHQIEQYAESWAIPSHLVTSGAYNLVSRVVNGTIKAQKNPYYYAAKDVSIAKLEFTPFADRNAAIAAFRSGAIDITANVPVDQYQNLKALYPTSLHTVTMEGMAFYSLNTKIPALQDERLRQALSMAVDRETLVNKILANGQLPLYSYVTPSIENSRFGGLNYEWASWSRKQQIQEAQKLYAAAGYSIHNPLRLNLLYNQNDASQKVALAIASMWKNVLGAEITLQGEEWKAYLQDRRNGNFQVLRNNWGAAYNNITTYTPEYQCNSNVNVSGLCLPEYDRLIAQANAVQNFNRQTEIYRQAIKLAMEQYAIRVLRFFNV
jgi:oligopeptide transport system substrate-binding protein